MGLPRAVAERSSWLQVAVGALLRVPAVLPAVRGDFAWVVAGHAINAAAGPGMRWAPGPDLCCVI